MSRRSNHSAEEKLKIVEACLAGEISICEAGQRAGVHHKTVIRWISRYKAEGPSAFLPSEHNRPYPAEVKYRAVEEYLSGKGSLQNICEKYKIRSEKQLRDWIKVYNCHEDFKTQSGRAFFVFLFQLLIFVQIARVPIHHAVLHSVLKVVGPVVRRFAGGIPNVRVQRAFVLRDF